MYADKARLRRFLWSLYWFTLLLVLVGVLGQSQPVGAQGGGTPLPPCPGPDAVGAGTPWPGPADVSWEYLLDCEHCLDRTPVPTSLLSTYVPTATVAPDVFGIDCAASYSITWQSPGGVQALPLTLHDIHPQVYGAVFTTRFPDSGTPLIWQTAYVEGFIPDDVTPLWLASSPSDNTNFAHEQEYCYIVQGYENLCSQYAPGAEVRFLAADGSYVPQPTGSTPLVLTMSMAGTSDPFWLSDLRLIYYADYSYSCPGDELPAGADEYFQSCSFTKRLLYDVGQTLDETPVDWEESQLPTTVYGFMFQMTTQGAEVRLGEAAEGESFFDSTAAGTLLPDGLYCIGDPGVCAAVGWDYPHTVIENHVVDVTTTHTMVFDIQADEASTAFLTGARWLLQGDPALGEGCSGEPEWPPTPTPEPELDVYMDTTPIMCGYGSAMSEGDPNYVIELTGTVPAGEPVVGFMELGHFKGRTKMVLTGAAGYYTIGAELENVGDYFGNYDADVAFCTAVLGGTYDLSEYGYTGAPFTGEDLCAGLEADVTGQGYLWKVEPVESAYLNDALALGLDTAEPVVQRGTGWWTSTRGSSYIDLCVYPLRFGVEPTEPQGTPTPTPTATVWATPTPFATVDNDQCRVIDWRGDTGPATEFDFDVDNLLGDTDCFNVVPEMSVTTPDLGAIGDLIGLDTYTVEWDGVELCAIWVNMPVWSVVGLNISMDWFLLPAVAWLINKLLSL